MRSFSSKKLFVEGSVELVIKHLLPSNKGLKLVLYFQKSVVVESLSAGFYFQIKNDSYKNLKFQKS